MPQAPQYPPIFENRLLAVLSREELERLAPHFQRVPLVLRETLYETGAISEFVYFPLNGVISTIAVMKDGSSTEVGVVGKEGQPMFRLFLEMTFQAIVPSFSLAVQQ